MEPQTVDGMDAEVMRWVLREFKAALQEEEEAWVVLDQAGWQVSPGLSAASPPGE